MQITYILLLHRFADRLQDNVEPLSLPCLVLNEHSVSVLVSPIGSFCGLLVSRVRFLQNCTTKKSLNAMTVTVRVSSRCSSISAGEVRGRGEEGRGGERGGEGRGGEGREGGEGRGGEGRGGEGRGGRGGEGIEGRGGEGRGGEGRGGERRA